MYPPRKHNSTNSAAMLAKALMTIMIAAAIGASAASYQYESVAWGIRTFWFIGWAAFMGLIYIITVLINVLTAKSGNKKRATT